MPQRFPLKSKLPFPNKHEEFGFLACVELIQLWLISCLDTLSNTVWK